jgi:DNA invertase Pin-like site-specific DNA recombinase
MNGLEKIRPEHRRRPAFVYVRQSTMAQVFHHQASTQRQFALSALATQLGWEPPLVELVAEDLGRSGKLSENRSGFQRLAAEVGLGRVGAIFSLEASRLARSSADWHRLLEIAGLTSTLLVDEQTVYDPRDANDRLILGVKGTMADFELVWLRQRMNGGRWHLAREGRYRMRLPIGYVYDGDQITKDPDEEIQRAINLLFERHTAGGSCTDIVRYFAEHQIRFPARDTTGYLSWSRLSSRRVYAVLKNPVYAGAYAFGRRRQETIFDGHERRLRVHRVAEKDWPVLRRDAHPGYISWDEYVANQNRLAENRPMRGGDTGSRGAAREGRALLQGLLLCGRCSQRVRVNYYGDSGRYPSYVCRGSVQEALGRHCFAIPSRLVDEPVIGLLLHVLTKEELDAAADVVELIEKEDAAVEQQWKLRLERALYEARRAERQYDACEPENRVVARTLETRWNEKLAELERLQHEHEAWRQRKRLEISDVDRQRIRTLADDLPALWHTKTTSDRERKLLLRLLINEVGVRLVDVPRSSVRVRVLWHTRAITELEIDRPVPGQKIRPVHWRVIKTSAPSLDTAT